MHKHYFSRAQSRAASVDHPVGDPYGGPAFGERNAPVIAALPVISQVLGAVGAAKSLFAKPPSAPVAPAAAAPAATPAPTTAAPKPVMPTMDSGMIAAQQQKVVAQKTASAGRQSTILSTGGSDKLGG